MKRKLSIMAIMAAMAVVLLVSASPAAASPITDRAECDWG